MKKSNHHLLEKVAMRQITPSARDKITYPIFQTKFYFLEIKTIFPTSWPISNDRQLFPLHQ